jgi:iron complex transport system ATP-binding protein
MNILTTVGELVSYGRFPHQKGFGRLSAEDKKEIDWALNVCCGFI